MEARKVVSYLKVYSLINTSVQKAGIPAVSGCLVDDLKHEIQARTEFRDFRMIFSDLTNAFGSVPQSVLEGIQLLSGP